MRSTKAVVTMCLAPLQSQQTLRYGDSRLRLYLRDFLAVRRWLNTSSAGSKDAQHSGRRNQVPSTSSIAADAEIWRFPISTEAASGPSLRTSTPFLAYNRHVPCPTQRTHAIGLWVARNTAWCAPFSAKYLRNSAFLTRGCYTASTPSALRWAS